MQGNFAAYDSSLVTVNGFAHGVAVTGEENPETVTFLNVVYVIPTNEGVKKAHTEATTGIQLVK